MERSDVQLEIKRRFELIEIYLLMKNFSEAVGELKEVVNQALKLQNECFYYIILVLCIETQILDELRFQK